MVFPFRERRKRDLFHSFSCEFVTFESWIPEELISRSFFLLILFSRASFVSVCMYVCGFWNENVKDQLMKDSFEFFSLHKCNTICCAAAKIYDLNFNAISRLRGAMWFAHNFNIRYTFVFHIVFLLLPQMYKRFGWSCSGKRQQQ